MGFAEKLEQYLKDNHLDQKDLAPMLNITKQAISAYINGTNTPSYNGLVKLCNILKVDANYFMRDDLDCILTTIQSPKDQILLDAYHHLTDSDKRIVDFVLGIGEDNSIQDAQEFKEPEPTIIYRFPVYNQDAAAGVGQLGRDDGYDMEEFVVDNIPDNAVFAMRISGESMNHKDTNHLIRTGSIVLINPKFDESELEDRIVIANFSGEVICKRYINHGSYILFQSDNDVFEKENRKSSDDPEYKVVGIVLGVIENGRFIKVK